MKGTEQFLEKMIDHVELSSTGTLNFAEFLVLMVKSQGEPIFWIFVFFLIKNTFIMIVSKYTGLKIFSGVNGVQRAFLSYDVDGSGSITREELKERLKNKWMSPTFDFY